VALGRPNRPDRVAGGRFDTKRQLSEIAPVRVPCVSPQSIWISLARRFVNSRAHSDQRWIGKLAKSLRRHTGATKALAAPDENCNSKMQVCII
jgi:hypothetical protein